MSNSVNVALTIVNLQNDSLQLAKSLKDALTGVDQREVQLAWRDVIANSGKVIDGLKDLSNSSPVWGKLLGPGSNLLALQNTVDSIQFEYDKNGSFSDIKANDALGYIGGLADFAGNFLIKPGPTLVAGLALKGLGTGTGLAQNIVGDQTIADLLGKNPQIARPLLSASEFPNVNDGKTFAPDGVTPLGQVQTTLAGNQKIESVWIKDSQGNYQKVDNVQSRQANGDWKTDAVFVGQYNSDGDPVKATQYTIGSDGKTTATKTMVSTAAGGWVDAPKGAKANPIENTVGQSFNYETTTLAGTTNAGMFTATEVTNTKTGQVNYIIRHNGTGEAIASGGSYVVNDNDTITTTSGGSQFTHGLTDGRLRVMQSADGSGFVVGQDGDDFYFGAGSQVTVLADNAIRVHKPGSGTDFEEFTVVNGQKASAAWQNAQQEGASAFDDDVRTDLVTEKATGKQTLTVTDEETGKSRSQDVATAPAGKSPEQRAADALNAMYSDMAGFVNALRGKDKVNQILYAAKIGINYQISQGSTQLALGAQVIKGLVSCANDNSWRKTA